MDLDCLSRGDGNLSALLRQSRQWCILDRQIKQVLPVNLHTGFQTACIENGILILLANSNMVASRLRMMAPILLQKIQVHYSNVGEIRIKMLPEQQKVKHSKGLRLSRTALAAFQHTAEQLQHFPELAEALKQLVENHRQQPIE